jgi:hypothetical protein
VHSVRDEAGKCSSLQSDCSRPAPEVVPVPVEVEVAVPA